MKTLVAISLCLNSFFVFSQNWTNYNENNSGLSSDIVTSIAIDNNDNVWVSASNGCAFQYGLNKFDGTGWTHYDHMNSGLVSDAIIRIICDNNNNLWIAYYCGGYGLTKFDGTNWITYDTSNSNIPSNLINDLFIDSHNDLWLVCDGITKFTGSSFIHYFSDSQTLNYFVTLYATDSVVYAVGEGIGLYKYYPSNGSFINYNSFNSNIPSTYFGSLKFDHNGILWMGSQFGFTGSTGGIATFDGNTFTTINPFTSPYTWVYYDQSIEVDYLNNVWVSNRCEGLYKYDGISWQHMGGNLPQSGCAGFIYQDNRGRMWYGDVYSGIWTDNPTVGIKDIVKNQFSISPNPFHSTTSLHLPNNFSKATLNIYTPLGALVKTETISGQSTVINREGLRDGIYFISVTDGENEWRGKMVVE